MKKPPPNLEHIRELEIELASIKEKLSDCWPQSMLWKEFKSREFALTKELKANAKKIKILFDQ